MDGYLSFVRVEIVAVMKKQSEQENTVTINYEADKVMNSLSQ